ncbi:DNA cytosine methyltransferase, partial [Limnobaculum sp. M2-1]|uniref:DNA cytosine methyltransferase n=1 Tax=Limnobaculum sp. M2-1 TaxID=2855838 RepID=UPI001C43855C
VWENVPGVLSDKTNAFGCFLAGLAGEDEPLQPSGKRWSNSGCVFGPERTVAWRILDAQYFGVAQRRRRVFVIASARKDINPTEILFEFDSMRRDIAPSRETGQEITGDVRHGLASGKPTTGTLMANAGTKLWLGNQEAFTGDYHVVVNDNQWTLSSIAYALAGNTIGRKPENGGNGAGYSQELGYTLTKSDQPGVAYLSPIIGTGLSIRRLIPIECERLQGFPDNHTLIPTSKMRRIEADELAFMRLFFPNIPDEEARYRAVDGKRYKALGNSMAV